MNKSCQNNHPHPEKVAAIRSDQVIRDPAIIRRVEIMCELFAVAFEMKSLELKRKYPAASDDWIRSEFLRLFETGKK